MPLPTIDAHTLKAVQVLVRAVENARMPGIVEIRTLERALEDFLEFRNETALEWAATVFDALPSEIREEIASQAETLARRENGDLKKPDGSESPAPVGERRVTGVTGFLAALNRQRSRG